MANVHYFGAGTVDYINSHGGSISKRGENAFDVDIPTEGMIALGGYSYHRGHTDLYAYNDGTVLDFTVETANHSLTLHRLRTGELQYFGRVDNPELLQSLAQE